MPEAPWSDLHLLVTGVRSGDEASFEALYRRFARLVHGILLARIPRALVEDAVQDVFLTAYAHLSALREPQAFGGWIAVIARRRAADILRFAPPDDPLSEDLAAPDASEADALGILRLIGKLPEAYREPLTLRLVEGMTGPEIAAATGLTPGSVRVNLHRGMTRLKELLGETGR